MKYSTHRVVFGEIRFLPRIIIPATFLLFIFFGVNMLFPPVNPTTFAEDDTTSITTPSTTTPNDASTISISPVSNVSIPVTPSANAKVGDASTGVGTGSTAVTVTTNAAAGYTLSMNTDTADASLKKGTSTENETIPTLGSGTYTLSSMPVNSWGFSKDGTNYQAVPSTSTPAADRIIKQTSAASTSGDTTNLNFAIKMDLSRSYGAYTSTVVFSAITNAPLPVTVTSVSPTQISAQDTTTKTITLTGTNLSYAETVQIGAETCTIDTSTRTDTTAKCTIGTNQGILDTTTDFDEAAKDAGISTGLTNMQEMTTAIRSAVSAPTKAKVSVNSNDTGQEITYYQETQAKDTRDNKLYWIAKLADGNVWMTQNLDYVLSSSSTLTPSDSNVSANWTPASSANTISFTDTTLTGWNDSYFYPYSARFNGADGNSGYYVSSGSASDDVRYDTLAACIAAGNTEALCQHSSRGTYYNWSAAVATNDTTGADSRTDKNMPDSICSKGWQLPVGNYNNQHDFYTLNQAYSITSSAVGSQVLRSTPLNFVRPGFIASNSVISYGWAGYYWSRTVIPVGGAYDEFIEAYSVNPSLGNTREFGFSVRCMAQ